MRQYRVTRPYQAVYRDEAINWGLGDIVTLPEEIALWVERDSPGLLQPLVETRQQIPAHDRMMRKQHIRGGQDEQS